VAPKGLRDGARTFLHQHSGHDHFLLAALKGQAGSKTRLYDMINSKKTIPIFLYNLLVVGLTNVIFGVAAIALLILLIGTKLDSIAWAISIPIILIYILGITLAIWLWQSVFLLDKASVPRVIGIFFGRRWGLVIGGILGAITANGIGIILGAVIFYFAGRWIGSRIGVLIGARLDRIFIVADSSFDQTGKLKYLKMFMTILYGALFPFLLVFIALLVKNYDGQFTDFPNDWLSIARIVIVVISLICVGAPWLIRKQISRIPATTVTPILRQEDTVYWVGLVISIVPVIYGFALFIFGSSILELFCYAFLSSTAALSWSIGNKGHLTP
jgi:hypothetical protein